MSEPSKTPEAHAPSIDGHGAPTWTIVVPLVAVAFVGAELTLLGGALPVWLLPVAAVLLFATVFTAVHHAETVAHRIGEPLGSIVLAVAVTVIEVSLIVSMLLGAPAGESSIARDTVFAAIMITLNGIVGLCLLSGGVRYHEVGFQARAATSALAVLGTVAVLGLILPNFTVALPGPTVLTALALLATALVGVVLLAETLAHPVEVAVAAAGLPEALVGVAIALVVLMPEGTAALKAARANRLQTSLNLALGSALASICLTIPTVAMLSLVMGQTLILGLASEHIVLLVLSLFVGTLTLATGRTTVLHGGIHLVIFAAFVTLAAVP
jgi:Ca2+:H+ antiporter